MYCPKCGEYLPDGTEVCDRCGASVLNAGEPGSAPAPKKLEQPLGIAAATPNSARSRRRASGSVSSQRPGAAKYWRPTPTASEEEEPAADAPSVDEKRPTPRQTTPIETTRPASSQAPAANVEEAAPSAPAGPEADVADVTNAMEGADVKAAAREAKAAEREAKAAEKAAEKAAAKDAKVAAREAKAAEKAVAKDAKVAAREAKAAEKAAAREAKAAEKAAAKAEREAQQRSQKERAERAAEARRAISPLTNTDTDNGGPVEHLKRTRRTGLIAVIAVVVAIVVVGVVGSVSASWIGPGNWGSNSSDKVTEEEAGSDEAVAADTTDDTEEEEVVDAEAEEEDDAITVRASVEDYSWDELSQISALISAATSDSEAIQIAIDYNLCDDDGTLDGTQTKTLTLTDGTTITMRIAGFNHDVLADDTSSTAGITFVAAEVLDSMQFNELYEEGEGWRDSSIRTYLNGDFLSLLPEDLSAVITTVQKTTSIPYDDSSSTQVQTDDTVWILSISEIMGEDAADEFENEYYMEGEQYQLYSDVGIAWGQSNDVLSAGGSGSYWWLRSVYPDDIVRFLCVYYTGYDFYVYLPGNYKNVVIGFCL